MSEQNPNLNPEQQEPEKPAYTPASFEKRTAAWMGIAYVLLIMFAVTFSIFTGGKTLSGTFPLFLTPVAGAALVITVHRQKNGSAPGGVPVTVFIVIACAAAAVLGLLTGVPPLIAAIQNAYR